MSDDKKKPQGFAAMTDETRREVASKGGKTAHANGNAHEWDAQQASKAGKISGARQTPEHMREISRLAQLARKAKREQQNENL